MKKCLSVLLALGMTLASGWAWAQTDPAPAQTPASAQAQTDPAQAQTDLTPAQTDPAQTQTKAQTIPAFGQGLGFKDMAWAGAALMAVLIALVLLLKALQRVGRFKSGRGSLFEVRGYQPLDNRKYLVAVAVDGRMLIIGVTPDRLIPLGQWPIEDQELFPPDGLDLGLKSRASEDAPPDISVVSPGDLRP